MVEGHSTSPAPSDTSERKVSVHLLGQQEPIAQLPASTNQLNNTDRLRLVPDQQTPFGTPLPDWHGSLRVQTGGTGQAGVTHSPGLPDLNHDVHLNNYRQQQLLEDSGIGFGYNGRNPATGQYPEYDLGNYAELPFGHHASFQSQKQHQIPPTPAASDQSTETRRTRSGRVISQSQSSQIQGTSTQDQFKVTKSPQGKKAKAPKREKPQTPKLTAPLSQLTQGYTHVPIRDMEAWVNRPAEVRWNEVEKRNGYVARPMNSFMLYRSAYAERTKMWCLQNNHQVVSSVSGESWPMETPEIREKYNNYAKIERENHQNAHPGYKFSPSKSNNPKKRKSGTPEVEESDNSEMDGLDSLSERGRANPSRASKRSTMSGNDSSHSSPYLGLRTRPHPFGGGLYQSLYQTTNSGPLAPGAMESHELYGQYYQPPVFPHMNHSYMEDPGMQQTVTAGSQHSGYPGLVGLPGAFHQDLYSQESSGNASAPLTEHLVDPTLLASVGGFPSEPTMRQPGPANMQSHHGFPPTYDAEQARGVSYGDLHHAYPTNSNPGEHQGMPSSATSRIPEFHDNSQGSLGYEEQWPLRQDGGSEFENWYHQEH